MVDGASRLQRIRYIDIPGLMPTAMVLLVLSTGRVLEVAFEKVYLMQSPLNLGVAEVINTYVYRVGLLSPILDFSYSTAIGLLKGIVGLLLLFAVNYAARPFDQQRPLVVDRPMASMTSYESNINKVNESYVDRIFLVGNTAFLLVVTIIILLPLVFIVAASFSSAEAVIAGKVTLWPVDFSLLGYETIFEHKKVWNGFANSIFYTFFGTVFNVTMTIIAAYPLSRQDFDWAALHHHRIYLHYAFQRRLDSHLYGRARSGFAQYALGNDPADRHRSLQPVDRDYLFPHDDSARIKRSGAH